MAPPDATDEVDDDPGRPRRPPRRRLVLAALAVLAVVVAGAAAVARQGPERLTSVVEAPVSSPRTSLVGSWPTTTTAPPPPTTTPAVEDGLMIAPPLPRPWATSWLVGDARVPEVALHSEPGVPVPSGRAMVSPTREGLDQVFLIRGRRPGWLLAQIMSRPNSAMAWIREADVTLRRVPHHIVIEREARRLTLYHGERPLLQVPVATGKASSPTPLGTFFVDARVVLSGHPSYGDGQVSFTGWSEVYDSFGGGDGQVAMHGTQNPALIGTPASNGCVRLTNADITRVRELAEAGTPVQVVDRLG